MTLPDKLTAAEFERLKAQEQRMLNSGSWVPQAENTWAAEMNAQAADNAAPATMTAEQADAALAQQSVAAETSFGRSMGARPDYSSGPAVNPADSEPKTIEELRRKQQELYHDPSYEMPFEEWRDFTRWQRETEGEVSGFLRGLSGAPTMLGQLGVGIVQERAQQYMRAMGGDPIGAATAEVATFKEMGRKIGVGLTQLTDWAGGKINDMVASGRRVGQVQANIVQALRDSGKLTGDPVQDNTIIQQAMEEAAAQGMFEPTQQQAEEDEETGYQRYLRNQAYTREYMGVTQYSIGGSPVTLPDVKKTATNPLTGQVEQPMESTATVAAMVASPENFIPIGVGAMARVRMLRRFASLTGKAFKGGEEAAAALDGMMMRGADRLTSRLPLIGDLSLNKRMAALGGVGAAAAYLDTQIDSPVVDVIAKPLIVAGAFLPSVKAAGATLRKVGSASGATWQVIKEMDAGAMGSVRAETAARMADSGKFNPRYARYMRAGAEGGVESTLRRVSQNADMPETLRRVARSADNIGITQLARGVDDVVSSAAVTGLVATPFALMAPDSETAGGIFGGAVLLGGTTGAAARVIGRRSARTDADIARMMVDVEMAGGDAGSLGALSYSGLDMLSAMQGITSGKVDFIPLRAQEYRANADVKANGGETTAGLHIEQAADGRAKVYVNMGHTAPVAGRVSIRSLENGNVVRIKGRNGESDFTFVPKEYPLLVKSGDFVEPNAHLARGLSPTRVMPHEIGHAILTSNILSGTVRDDLRNIVNQRYDTPGVELRGREYVTRLVDKDIMAGAHDQLPDKLTQQEFDDIASGKRTLADVLKGKPVSEAQRTQMIDDRYQEMRERSIAQGDNPDGLDVFRDEIVAETFSSLSEGIDFRRMRTGGPQVMESMLAATTRVFETLGMAFNPSTGKPLDNPSVIFRDNPLMQDPVMRKRMQEHLRNYEAWMLGMEQAGAREQRGTQISVDGTAESARRSTHTKLRANENGILENDLIYIDQNGTAQWKSQGVLDQQERGRSAQVGQLYDKNKIVAPNSAEFGLRRTGGGRTIISGPTLPAKFDVLRWFPKHVREMARMLEASRDRGASHIFDYNTIGTGEGGRYRVINRGDVQAILREGAFLGWEATKVGHLKAVIMDLNAFRAAAMKAINKGELGIFNNDMAQVHADLLVYLSNHKNGLPGEATIGQQKRDMLNGLIGTGTAVQRDINPLYTDLNPRGSVRTFRIDRVNDITPTGRDGYHFDYDKIKNNRMPQQIPRDAQAMPDYSGRADIPLNERARRAAFVSADGRVVTTGKRTHFETNEDLGPDFLAIGAGSIGEDGFFRFGSETMDDAMGETPSQSIAAAARHNQAVYRSGQRPSALLEDPPGLERMGRQAMPDAPRRYVSMEKFIEEAGDELGEVLPNAYKNLEFNDDNYPTHLVSFSDARNSMYRSRVPSKEFFDWLHSDRVMDGLVFADKYEPATAGEGATHTRESYQALINRLRDISLRKPKPAAARRGQAMPDAQPAGAPPFYMKSTRVLDAKIQGKAATVDQVRAILTNPQNGIKAEELKWTGVLQAAERLAKENNGKVPKDALLQYLADDGAVRLEEVTYGQAAREARMRDQARADLVSNGIQNPTEAQITQQLEEFWPEYDDGGRDIGGERYDQYQLPGGENYREVVLAMPVKPISERGKRRQFIDQRLDAIKEMARQLEPLEGVDPAAKREMARLEAEYAELAAELKTIPIKEAQITPEYTSPHFDTPNYVAHMRLNERTDAAGKPGLFLEEIQSDRHQAGREKGYVDAAIRNEQEALLAKQTLSDGDLARIEEIKAMGQGDIPDAPFRKDWPVQMFKRALADAVENGKEWIGWTTGETQAARYDLSKQVKSIDVIDHHSGEGRFVDIRGKDGESVMSMRYNDKGIAEDGKPLSDYIGKELAEKVMKLPSGKREGSSFLVKRFSGIDLKVGGEGMKGFYDQILPKEISKYVKQWGGQVEKGNAASSFPTFLTENNGRWQWLDENREPFGKAFPSRAAAEKYKASGVSKAAPIWRVNITPQMREGIKKAGQALFVGGVAAVVAEEEL